MIENSTLEKIENDDSVDLEKEYYKCEFNYCDFSNMALADTIFDNCIFTNCNFSLVKFTRNFRDAKFVDCKMTGADFTGIGKFSGSFYFDKTNLNYANFGGAKLRKSKFIDCKIVEADFEEADLSFSVFDRCDLTRSSFFGTNLESVDFATAYDFTINPTASRLKKTIFSEQELRGLLSHLDIIIK